MSEQHDKVLEMFGLPETVVGSKEWQEIEKLEFSIGPEALLEKIIDQKQWTNVELVWVIKRLVYYYGRKDELLKFVPVERIFTNITDILRAFLLIIDITAPDIDDNMRSYISTKMADATWGINERTRVYLEKIKNK